MHNHSKPNTLTQATALRRLLRMTAWSLAIQFGVPDWTVAAEPEPSYTIAFASFSPRNTDLFLADADGKNPKPLVPHSENDYNASFSRDGRWIIFTSHRSGSADIYRVRPDGTGLERLTDGPAFDDQAALSPDGRQLVFVSSRGGHANLWFLDLATRKVCQLTKHDHGDFRPVWSSDGQWIAFSSDRDSTQRMPKGGFVYLHSTELYVIHADGSSLRRLTKAQAYAGSPSWAPKGSRLTYYEADLENVGKITLPRLTRGTTQIVTLDLDTSERRVLTTGEGEKWSPRWLEGERVAYLSGGPDGGLEFTEGPAGARGEFGSPNWSPDDRQVVFHREVDHAQPPLRSWPSRDPRFRLMRSGIFPSYAPSGEYLVCNSEKAGILHNRILRMNSDGSSRSVLFEDPDKSALAPVWSPRGDRIAFGLGTFFPRPQRYFPAQIAVIRKDGTGLQMLTETNGNCGFPSWSPDGRRLVYRSASETGGKGLRIIDTETRKVTVLSNSADNDNFPAWSPLGDRIAFTTNRDDDWEIYSIRADGTDLRRLTHSKGNDAHCAWSPDGEWIAFSSRRGSFKDETVLFPGQPAQADADIYVMRADGSDVRQLTDDQFEEATPTFVPLPRRK